tara:strand:+ start:97 stop:234 length:138 start_codon:yes stop_codon:yes gene_type:complete
MSNDKEVTESKKDATNAKALEQSKEFKEAKKEEMRRRMAAFSDCV